MNTMTPSSGPRGLIATAILGALASSVSAVSAADAGTEPVSLTVKFADLNVSQPRGAAVRCVHDAIANAVMKVNQPALFVVYNAKNKTQLPTTLVSQSR